MKKNSAFKTRWILIGIPILTILVMAVFMRPILQQIGRIIVLDETPENADAVVVLNTGLEYYPRLIQAADVYRKGLVKTVVINGNRKTDVMRELEAKGFQHCCPWYVNSVRILSLLGVPENDVIWISAEDVYDTISEAETVGNELLSQNITNIIITTSKFHTRRARHIWHKKFGGKLSICMVAAKSDPFDPDTWWQEGRQIRWVLAEYGAWVFYLWKTVF